VAEWLFKLGVFNNGSNEGPEGLPTAAPTDEEFGEFESEEIGLEQPYDEEEPRRFHPIALWFGMAVLGVVLAVAWRSFGAQRWFDSQRWLTSAAASSSSGTSPVEKQLESIATDLEALKKNMDELRVAQQQTAANVMSLQAGQQELQRRLSSFQGAHWYSDFAVLTYPTAAAKKPAAAAPPKQMPTARVPSEAQDANVGRRNDGEPLSLISPRP
jgi:hypothetical protein